MVWLTMHQQIINLVKLHVIKTNLMKSKKNRNKGYGCTYNESYNKQ